MSDLDVFKDIPGYKAILKSVLKSQIQLLLQQLSESAGEESIILTASVHDGTLSHLGSSTGKGFLEGRDEIKSQFLGYCLKTYHKQKTHEPQKPYQRTHPSPRNPAQMPAPKRTRVSASTYRSSPVHSFPVESQSFHSDFSDLDSRKPITSSESESPVKVKTELMSEQSEDSLADSGDMVRISMDKETINESLNMTESVQSNVATPGTMTADFNTESSADISNNRAETSQENIDTDDMNNSNLSTIKVEQVEDELEITGVEMAAASMETWGQGHSGYGDNSSMNQTGELSGYSTIPGINISGYHGVAQRDLAAEPGSFVYPKKKKEHRCQICGKVFGSRADLVRHDLIHSGLKPFHCEICGRDFRLSQHLRTHKYAVHDVLS